MFALWPSPRRELRLVLIGGDKMSFSLADIDPADIQVEDLGKGEFAKVFAGESAVSFHTTDYRKAIIDSTKGPFYPGGQTLAEPSETPTSNYILITNDWFAPRFAKAFKHAVELCGGKRSSSRRVAITFVGFSDGIVFSRSAKPFPFSICIRKSGDEVFE